MKVEIIHIGEDYYTIAFGKNKVIDVSFTEGQLIENILKGIIKSINY